MTEKTLFNTNAAAEWLHEHLPGESVAFWRNTLINNRRNDRKPLYRLPVTTIGRGAFYAEEALVEFLEAEKARRIGTVKLTGRAAEAVWAFGVGSGGSTTGRPLNVTAINPQIGEDGTRFIQMIVSAPHLLVFRLDVAQAEAIARDLAEAAAYLKRGA